MSKKNRFVVRKDSCDATGENQWAVWYASTNELWAWSTSSTKAKQLCDLLNSTIYEEGDKSTPATAAEPKPQASATSTYHVYASHDLVNQTFCYKVRRKDAEGVEYLVSTFDNVDAAIKERDRLNAEAKAAQQPTAADPVDAPDHYRQGEIECIDAVKAMLGDEGFAYWLRGNMVAYLWRLPHKGEAKKDAGKTRNLAERLERLLAE